MSTNRLLGVTDEADDLCEMGKEEERKSAQEEAGVQYVSKASGAGGKKW